MPKTKISEFSSTPANNTDIDSINIAEGCAPSGINDAIRELMAQLKDFQVGSAGDPVTVGGVLTVTAGAVGTPAITTAGDTNTGIFFPAADTMAFVEGGAEAVRITSAGDVGIGTNAPASKLQVVGIGSFGAGPSDATNATVALYSQGTTGISIEAFQGNNTAVKKDLYLSAFGGNVGIGNTTPSTKLHVIGDTIASNYYFGTASGVAGTIGATSSGSGAALALYGSTASPANTFVFNTPAGEQARLNNTGLTAKQFLTAGTDYTNGSNFDVTTSLVVLANNGFIDNVSFSGMFVLNNHTTGGVSIWLCGAGSTSQVSSVSGGAGMSVTFNAGISGYTIQNLTGVTVNLGTYKLRTRNNA
jgi:hypothetical protein